MNMLRDFLAYDLLVAALLTVFYMFYRLLLERETFFRLNRVVLLTVCLLALVLPLCRITLHETIVAEAVISADGQHAQLMPVGSTVPTAAPRMAPSEWFFFYFGPWIGLLLAAGVLFRLGYVAKGILSLRRIIRGCELHTLADGTRVAVSPEPLAPCSWMNTIVMSRADYNGDNAAIIAHERAHIGCGHSRDVLLMELLTALQWWNPVVWFLRQDLRTLHEYEADAGVLSQGFDTKQYIQLLMQKARGVQVCALANGIKSNKTKNRILMMLRTSKSPMSHRLRVLYILPIAALSLAMTAKTVYTYDVKKVNKAPVAEQQDSTVRVIPAKGRLPQHISISNPDVKQVIVGGEKVTSPGNRPVAIEWNEKMLLIIDGREITSEAELDALQVAKEDIDAVWVLGSESATKEYGEKGKDGAVIMITKQAVAQGEDLIFSVCEEAPKYEGGDMALMQLIAQNMKYPEMAIDEGVQGRVIVQLVVEKDGSISQPQVITNTAKEKATSTPGVTVTAYGKDDPQAEAKAERQKTAAEQLNQEAIRVVRMTSGHWTPGRQLGQPVRSRFTLPVNFRLN